MGANTKIEWATHTLNFWEGCTKVSEGCKNCYAAERDQRFHAGAHWGPGARRRLTAVSTWQQADKWNREAEESGRRPRVFINSLSDWLDEEVDPVWLATALSVMMRAPCCNFLLLTKRPERWREAIQAAHDVACIGDPKLGVWLTDWLDGTAPSNLWLGTTVENQAAADKRIPDLVEIPALVRYLSAEPLLAPVDLHEWIGAPLKPWIDWVIVGGESGRGARAMHPDWVRAIREECFFSKVPFFFKQWGAWAPLSTTDGKQVLPFGTYTVPTVNSEGFGFIRKGKHAAGRVLDGVEHNEIPAR